MCQFLPRDDVDPVPMLARRRPARMAIGQHAIHAGESSPLPTWTGSAGGQVQYTDAAVGISNDHGWSSGL